MDTKDWERIQLNWTRLTKDIVWSSFRDTLVDRAVLDEEDVQRIEKEKEVHVAQNETLLYILKAKPRKYQAFKRFFEILYDDNRALATLLEETVLPPHHFQAKEETEREAVRLALLVFYEERQGCQIRLPLLRRTLETELLKEGHHFDWKDERVCDFVKQVFSASVRINRHGRGPLRIENLSRRTQRHQREKLEEADAVSTEQEGEKETDPRSQEKEARNTSVTGIVSGVHRKSSFLSCPAWVSVQGAGQESSLASWREMETNLRMAEKRSCLLSVKTTSSH